jgi:hypothetical protein
MKQKKILIFSLFAAILLSACLNLQVHGQHLIGLTENQEVMVKARESDSRLKTTLDEGSLILPFFDDFSAITVYPDPSRWTDNYAFINSSFPDLPPTIGVATLDAIDATGEVYATGDQVTPSDTLTSREINLLPYKGTVKQVLLSFFYQAGGKGELPDPSDSLVVDYFSVGEKKWKRQWKAVADTAGPFIQAILTVPQAYYDDGFRFRFRNFTSMSPNEVRGKYGALSNVDQWHIDYVRLDTNTLANHQSPPDIALVDPLTDLLFQYVTVPWHHLNFAQSIGRNKVRYVIRNLEQGFAATNIDRSYFVTDLNDGITDYYWVYNEDIKPAEVMVRNDPFDHSFTRTSAAYGRYDVTAYINTPPSQFRGNDTVKYRQEFRDVYAYDDGTAEYGFGISGESTLGALTACRFPIFRKDTIRGIDIFFNKTRNRYTADLTFNLCIWENRNGYPGDTLYVSAEEFTPDTAAGLLEFTRYRIPLSRDIVVSDTVFVGIKQLSEDFLNIGYDVSHDNRNNIVVNVTGSWFSVDSLKPAGSLMMRPVFSRQEKPTAINTPSANETLIVFPVPASDMLWINLPEAIAGQAGEIQVYDMLGRKVLNRELSPALSVDQLKPGVYILRLLPENGKALVTRFMISR